MSTNRKRKSFDGINNILKKKKSSNRSEQKMSSIVTNEERKAPRSLVKFGAKYKNPHMRFAAQKHLEVVNMYEEKVLKKDISFPSKDEYLDYAIGRFFWDEHIHDSVPIPMETGETVSPLDPEDEFQKFLSKLPPLTAFHMSRDEKLMKKKHFWQNIKEGDVLNLQVINNNSEDDKNYEMCILNKHVNKERLVELSIKAFMKKEDTTEILLPGRFIRAVAIAYLRLDDITLQVTIKPSIYKMEEPSIKLGPIKEADIPFIPINVSNYNSLCHFMKSHPAFNDVKMGNKLLVNLQIDPYRAYLYNTSLNGTKSTEVEKDEFNFNKGAELLKRAQFFQKFYDYPNALMCVNEVIELIPDFVQAYVYRGKLYLELDKDNPNKYIKEASLNFVEALKRSCGTDSEAIKEYSKLLLLSAKLYIEENSYLTAQKKLKTLLRLSDNEDAKAMLLQVEEKLTLM